MKRFLSKLYPLAVWAFIAFLVLSWLQAESAIGHRFEGAPEGGGIFGNP
jgi:hypothetical protein